MSDTDFAAMLGLIGLAFGGFLLLFVVPFLDYINQKLPLIPPVQVKRPQESDKLDWRKFGF